MGGMGTFKHEGSVNDSPFAACRHRFVNNSRLTGAGR